MRGRTVRVPHARWYTSRTSTGLNFYCVRSPLRSCVNIIETLISVTMRITVPSTQLPCLEMPYTYHSSLCRSFDQSCSHQYVARHASVSFRLASQYPVNLQQFIYKSSSRFPPSLDPRRPLWPGKKGHYKPWTVDSGLDRGLDSIARLNNGLGIRTGKWNVISNVTCILTTSKSFHLQLGCRLILFANQVNTP